MYIFVTTRFISNLANSSKVSFTYNFIRNSVILKCLVTISWVLTIKSLGFFTYDVNPICALIIKMLVTILFNCCGHAWWSHETITYNIKIIPTFWAMINSITNIVRLTFVSHRSVSFNMHPICTLIILLLMTTSFIINFTRISNEPIA